MQPARPTNNPVRSGRHLLILAVVFAAGGAIYGLETNRWSSAEDVVKSERFAAIGAAVGNWTGDEPTINIDEKEKTYTYTRRYKRRDGRMVQASVVGGPAGFIAAHTPDVCYPGTGYQMKGDVSRAELATPSGPARTCVGDFAKHDAVGSHFMKIYWCWSDDGHWDAPTYPRFYYARSRGLTKIYLIVPYAEDDLARADELFREFAPVFLAEVGARMFPRPGERP
jgi:hypothetical protein